MTEPPQEHIVIDAQREPSALLDINDPPPPYPSPQRRTRTQRTGRRHRTARLSHTTEQDHATDVVPHHQRPVSPGEPVETTPLLTHAPSGRRHFLRPRSTSHSSTIRSSSSCAPSLAQTVLSLFHDPEDESEADIADGHGPRLYRHDRGAFQGSDVHDALHHQPTRWPLFSKRGWVKYFRPFGRRAYHAAVFHLLVLNFPYALIAWIYLFVFTLTGTTLIIALPIGAVLCFLDLLGARAFARAELALQIRFHGPLAYPPPYPSYPIFQRTRPPMPSENENGSDEATHYETSFYKNTYAMFADPTTYQALFYFLVIKPSITLGATVLLVVVVPVSYLLVLPAPLMLRVVRNLGIWQANVAVEGLYSAVS
ncbi:hypothetical protein V8B97DRAFT_1936579 [Scleroderma yunnanense]